MSIDSQNKDRTASAALRKLRSRSGTLAAIAVSLLAAAPLTGTVAAATGGAPPPTLPADFPADIGLPPGSLQGSTGGAGRWSVLILANGSATAVEQSTESFYIAAGFIRDGFAILHRGDEHITIVAENRDHSPTETNLTLGITTGGPGGTTGPATAPPTGAGAGPATPGATTPATGAAPVATILAGRASVRLATARRRGLRVRFNAPLTARDATVSAYRSDGAGRRRLGTITAAVHDGTNSAALASAATRRRIKPGLYTIEVVLRDARGTHGPAATTSVRVLR
jgi:hypothetical protein